MNEFLERITNLRSLNYDQLIQQSVEHQLEAIHQAVPDSDQLEADLAGMCKVLASNIQAELHQAGIQARLLDFSEIADVDHWSLIVERANGGYIIDPSYQQFCTQPGRVMRNHQRFFDQKLANPSIADNLKTQGYHKATQHDLADYLASFESQS